MTIIDSFITISECRSRSYFLNTNIFIICICTQYYGQPPYLPPAHATTAPPPTDKVKDDHKGDPKADLKVRYSLCCYIQDLYEQDLQFQNQWVVLNPHYANVVDCRL